jgi:Nuclease-related domain
MTRPTLWQRLRQWREIIAVRPQAEDPEVLGGRQAEHFLKTLVQSHHNFQGASLYANKRVPAGYRRREIDLVVVTAKRIHVIEVKNWSGTLQVVGDKWVQTRRGGQKVEHPDLVADHLDKNAALVAYLNHEGVSLDPQKRRKYLANKVIFMNRHLEVLSRSIADHPDVLLPARLNDYLERERRPGLGQALLGSIVRWCLDSESAEQVMDGYYDSLTGEKVAAVHRALEKLGTWDTLQYLGTRVETGDLIRLTVGGQEIPRDRLAPRSATAVRWTRSPTLGFLKALLGVGHLGWLELPGKGGVPVAPGDTLFFHRAGEQRPETVPLKAVERITLG